MNKKLFASLVVVGVLVSGMFGGFVKKAEAATVTIPVGSTFFGDIWYNSYYKVQDSKGNTINAKTTTSTTLTGTITMTNNISYGTVSFVDYDKDAKKIYKVPTSTQAYKTASTSSKLTAKNYLGKTVNVKVPAGNVMTKINTYWTKDSFKYTDYVKVKGKWIKQTKTATIYVPSKYVKGYTSYFWKKYTKKRTGYFFTPVKNGITLEEYNLLRDGMTFGMSYNAVVTLTGEKMILTSKSSKDGHSYKSYEWEYDVVKDNNWIWKWVLLDFKDGKLVFKHQSGLY
ncbi:hypothetical protein IEC97_10210 [Neobacillus cucumis]|uniref:hypothetical protein n=1 Tax=Neobacillus cucumis TaxID=1740721 RepID=UPI0018DF30FB|nr:hypothetical protein [Neobacillus cucumis]MBI0577735.1 hypothetical protein [Neobacillus cucumis]